MAKLISLKQQEGHDARATAYIKAYMLFPAGILGLISMIGGVGGLGYQLIATDSLDRLWRARHQVIDAFGVTLAP